MVAKKKKPNYILVEREPGVKNKSVFIKLCRGYLFVASTDKYLRVYSLKNSFERVLNYKMEKSLRGLVAVEDERNTIKVYLGYGKRIRAYVFRIPKDKNTPQKDIFYESNEKFADFHTGRVRKLFVEGNILYSCGYDRMIGLWSIEKSSEAVIKPKYRLAGHDSAVTRIKVVDQRLYSCSEDCSIIIWDLQLVLAPPVFWKSLNMDYLEFIPDKKQVQNVKDFHHRDVLMFLCSFGKLENIEYLLTYEYKEKKYLLDEQKFEVVSKLKQRNETGERYLIFFFFESLTD